MTVPMYFLLLAAICLAVWAMFGLASIGDDRKQLDELWSDEPLTRATAEAVASHGRPYDWNPASVPPLLKTS